MLPTSRWGYKMQGGLCMVTVRKSAPYAMSCAAMLAALLLLPDICSLPLRSAHSRLFTGDFDAEFWLQYVPVWAAELFVLLASLLLLKACCFRQTGAWGAFVAGHKCTLFVLLIALFFCASNARILLKGGFLGYYSGWDYGDLLAHLQIYGGRSNLYDSNYPPVATLLYRLFYMFIPALPSAAAGAYGYVLFLFFLGTALPLFVLLAASAGGTERSRLLLAAACFVSGPVLYVYQRANVAFFALILLLLYLCCFRSEKRFVREFALLALALSANIKYYPAVFGMLLLKERRWGDAVRCAAYGVAMFVLPALFSPLLAPAAGIAAQNAQLVQAGFVRDTVQGMQAFTGNGNLAYLTGVASSSLSLKVRLYNAVLVHLGLPDALCNALTLLVTLLFFAVTLVLVLLAEKRYQELFLLGSLCIFVPTMSFWYSVLFLIPALLCFLQEEQDSVFCSCAGLLLFCALFCYAVALSYALTPDRIWHILLLYALFAGEVLAAWSRRRTPARR
ncbi:MAG TPA: hypothetical protein DDW78_03160 [Treponema sp.]|nr:hypothetical protein [Treponema sp.]